MWLLLLGAGLFPTEHPAATLPWLSAAECAGCHPDEHEGWLASRHRASWTSALFQAEYALDPLPECVACHAPLPAQQAAAAHEPAHPSLAEGITCVTCHLRDSVIIATAVSGEAPHPSRVEPALSTSDFCATCHEFHFASRASGVLEWTEEPMQATWTEWRDWGGQETCQDCHMPDGDHRAAGSHDVDLLRRSVQVTAHHDGARRLLILEAAHVGHAVPTGDLFRHLTVSVDSGSGPVEVAWLGRRFGWSWDTSTETHQRRQVEDSRLHPGQPFSISVPASAQRWAVRYHYTRDADPAVLLASGAWD